MSLYVFDSSFTRGTSPVCILGRIQKDRTVSVEGGGTLGCVMSFGSVKSEFAAVKYLRIKLILA